ncbi:MAG: hypothetical protein U0V64_09670 [Cyclobacteriaceae bacterium]
MHRKSFLFVAVAFFIVFACDREKWQDPRCIYGQVVGQKCGVWAVQISKDTLGAASWNRKNTDGTQTKFDQVIGVIALPLAYQSEGAHVYMNLRALTQADVIICTDDLPALPQSKFAVVSAGSKSCSR